jgi:hypothetical protein
MDKKGDHSMKSYQRIGFVLGAIMAFTLSGPSLLALDSEESRATLRGLKRVYIVVEELDSDIVNDGLTNDQIYTDVGQKLRQAGIEFLSEESWQDKKRSPCVYVRPNVYKPWPGFYFCCIDISLIQDVLLKRNPSITVLSPTWSTGKFGVTHSLKGIRDSVKDCVDIFLNAYLSMNPKQKHTKPMSKH